MSAKQQTCLFLSTQRSEMVDPTPSECLFYANYHFAPNNKMKVITNTATAGDCCDLCWLQGKCVGFAWQPVNGGTCILKDSVDGASVEKGTVSGMIDLTHQFIPSCTYRGNRMFSTTIAIFAQTAYDVASPEGCCKLCRYMPGCISFVWYGRCVLYDSIGTRPLVVYAGVTAGFLSEMSSVYVM